MDNKLINNENEINDIFDNIKELVISSRNRVYTTVNTEMPNLYWNIGKAIMEIQQGDERASYGETVLEKLSQKLTNEFGKGFSKRNLERMRKFYIYFPIATTVSTQLSWSHYLELLKVDEEPKSSKSMSLKQAYDLYKKVMKFQNGIDKISKGNFTDEDSIKTIITSLNFIFNMSKNKSQYEKNTFKGMQFAFWQAVIEVGGRYAEFPISAEFLQHSLEENPEDLYIKDGNIVETIEKDNNFQSIVKKIVEEKGKDKDSFEFNSKDDVNHEYDWAFNDKDLYFALHLVDLKISA